MSATETRIQVLNDRGVATGDYVLYWMQQSQRAEHNPALDLAIREANRLALPVVAAFGLTDDYPDANLRHYRFLLEGLQDVDAALKRKGIRLVVRRGSPPAVALALGRRAALIVGDVGYTRHQREWRRELGAPKLRAGRWRWRAMWSYRWPWCRTRPSMPPAPSGPGSRSIGTTIWICPVPLSRGRPLWRSGSMASISPISNGSCPD
jgi:hypothetical protein